MYGALPGAPKNRFFDLQTLFLFSPILKFRYPKKGAFQTQFYSKFSEISFS